MIEIEKDLTAAEKVKQVLKHPLTEVTLRGVAGTVFVVKSARHFRKGNWVRGALFGISGVQQLGASLHRAAEWKRGC